MKWLMKKYGKLLWTFAILAVFPGTVFSEPGSDRSFLHSRQTLILPEIWLGSGFLYSPFYIQPLPIYPEIPGLYPCFPFGSCVVLQPFRKYEHRKKHPQPEPVFKRGEPLVDEAMEAWRAGLHPKVAPFRTDEQQIVPAFREHSLIRPEYENVGSILPGFLADEAGTDAESNQANEGIQPDE